MASFQAKIGWKMSRKREYKEYRSNPTRNRKFQKNSKKFEKIKKYRYLFFLSQNRFEKDEKQRK